MEVNLGVFLITENLSKLEPCNKIPVKPQKDSEFFKPRPKKGAKLLIVETFWTPKFQNSAKGREGKRLI